MLLCEAAGFDVVLVETVGVGQSETAVADMVDFFLLLHAARRRRRAAGHQGGILELADLVVVNKADGDPTPPPAPARRSARHCGCWAIRTATPTARHRHAWRPQVMQLSALKGDGLQAFWTAVTQFRDLQTAQGRLMQRRSDQDRAWMWERISAGLQQRFRQHAAVQAALPHASADVRAGRVAPSVAARHLLALLDTPFFMRKPSTRRRRPQRRPLRRRHLQRLAGRHQAFELAGRVMKEGSNARASTGPRSTS